MDFAKLNPWNWFKKEDDQEKALQVHQTNVPAKRTDYSPLESLHTEIDRVFESFFRGFGFPTHHMRTHFLDFPEEIFKPRVDISGSNKEYLITAELPGIDEKDIEIELKGDSLLLKAKKQQEEKSEDKGYYRVERQYGSYQRVLAVPEDADRDNIKASYKNGVITITLPRRKVGETDSKPIAIESE